MIAIIYTRGWGLLDGDVHIWLAMSLPSNTAILQDMGSQQTGNCLGIWINTQTVNPELVFGLNFELIPQFPACIFSLPCCSGPARPLILFTCVAQAELTYGCPLLFCGFLLPSILSLLGLFAFLYKTCLLYYITCSVQLVLPKQLPSSPSSCLPSVSCRAKTRGQGDVPQAPHLEGPCS